MIFVTNNTWLSQLKPNDAEALTEWLQEKEISTNTLRIPYPYTIEHAREWIERILNDEKLKGYRTAFPIRDDLGKMIGNIGIFFNYGLNAGKSEFGYWLAKPYWGKGIMTAVIDGFGGLVKDLYKIKTLEAHVFAFNIASQKALLKAGFTQKEFLPGYYNKNGELIDAIKFVKQLV
jgi:ribosomal-protein-alanine N-acetyltransferase